MPYAHGPSVRRLSKIATLLLAKNYILMLQQSVEELKRLVADRCSTSPQESLSRRRRHVDEDSADDDVGDERQQQQQRRRRRAKSPACDTVETSPSNFDECPDQGDRVTSSLSVEHLLRPQRATITAAQRGVMTSLFPLQLSMASPFVASPPQTQPPTAHLSKLHYGAVARHQLLVGGASSAEMETAVVNGGIFTPWNSFRQTAGGIAR